MAIINAHLNDCYAFFGLCSGVPAMQLQAMARDEAIVLAAETLRRKMAMEGLSEQTGIPVKHLREFSVSQLVGLVESLRQKAQAKASMRTNFPRGTKVRCCDVAHPYYGRIGMVVGREHRAPYRSTIRWDDCSETRHPLPLTGMEVIPENGETIAERFSIGAKVRYVWGKCRDRHGQVATVICKNGRVTLHWPDGTSPRRDCKARFFVAVKREEICPNRRI